jgi:hypothetical protein
MSGRHRSGGRRAGGETDRGVSTALGVALVVAITAATAATAAIALAPSGPPEPAPRAAFELRVDAGTDAIAVVHAGGDPIDPAELRLRIRVDGTPVAHQPPVPFFSARGYRSGPTGPFNRRWDGVWRAGVPASVRLAGTNTGLAPGDRVRVRLYAGGRLVADLNATARGSEAPPRGRGEARAQGRRGWPEPRYTASTRSASVPAVGAYASVVMAISGL